MTHCTRSALQFLLLLAVILVGCDSDAERAQKLYDQGKYEEIVSTFGGKDIPCVRSARERIAEKLLEQGRYKEILDNYQNTPSSQVALEKLAEEVLKEGRFEDVLMNYSATPAAIVARDSLAERLYIQKRYRDVLSAYPTTKAAEKVKKAHPEVIRAIDREKQIQLDNERRKRVKALMDCVNNPSNCLRVGMTWSQVQELISRPNDINRTVYAGLLDGKQHVHEQLIYRKYKKDWNGNYVYDKYSGSYERDDWKSTYIYLEDNILTSWQE